MHQRQSAPDRHVAGSWLDPEGRSCHLSTVAPSATAAPTTPAAPHRPGNDVASLLLKANIISPAQASRTRRIQEKLPGRSFLSIIRDLGYATDDQAKKVLHENRLNVSLGSLLVELGYLKQADLDTALEAQKASPQRKRLGEILVEHRFIDEQRLIEVLSIQLGFPQVAPDYGTIDRDLMHKVNPKWCKQHLIAPMKSDGAGTLVAMANPLDGTARESAESMFGGNITIGIAGRREILDAIATLEKEAGTDDGEEKTDIDVVKLVEEMIIEALKIGVSDIHVEPLKNRLRVRFRRDGVLEHWRDFNIAIADTLIARIKIMSSTGISDKRRHQDGRIRFECPSSGQSSDLRVSFYATINGQKIVLRVLNRKAVRIDIRETGLAPRVMERFLEEALDVPSGVIMITGPTGSGKTTTLYGAVNYLNNDETSIVTAEDPVEYMVDGIAQCSINPQINITFEETLRHMVRQDPDVIVLGEIRDNFSAEAAIQAALTGHKVLTTFHTEDTIGGLLRLMNMDIETFLISSTVVSVLAQRLLRRVCPHCAQPYKLTAVDLRRLGYAASDVTNGRFMVGKGCDHCRYSGYAGRVGVFELLVLNEDVKNAIRSSATSSQIRRVSMETSGLVTLIEDGIAKAALGQTTVAEVLKNLPRMEKPRPIPEILRLTGLQS
jgi:type IV pilus assembly protein PilB